MNAKKRILVADDNIGIVVSLTMVLQYGGYEVASLMDGQEVMKISQHLPDLILLDIWMAGINGLDVCRYLKSNEETRNIPIIMISAYPDSDVSAREAGANDFIEKPYSMNYLLETVNKHLQAATMNVASPAL